MGANPIPRYHPFGCHGNHTQWVGWPKAHGPLGGKYALERRRWGSSVYIPPVPLGMSSQMAPRILGLDYVDSGGPRSHLLVVKIGKIGLVILVNTLANLPVKLTKLG